MSDRQATLDGLRALAEYLEARPDVPLPFLRMVNAYGQPEDLAVIAKAMGGFQKDHYGDYLALVKTFGPVKLHVSFHSQDVCERVVVGVEEIPAKPAHTREIVEWKCPESVLSLAEEPPT